MDKRFFESTRGRIVMLLRGTTKTVNELAAALELTDNAVRAHLLSLERDGLIKQSGVQRGTRKPHFAYELTDEAEHLFPKAYDALLNQLITTLKGRLSHAELEEVLRESGRALVRSQSLASRKADASERLDQALRALEGLGGAARIERDGRNVIIRSESCPLATAVAEHPEVCSLLETLLSEIMGTRVHERCDRDGTPRCRFEVTERKKNRG